MFPTKKTKQKTDDPQVVFLVLDNAKQPNTVTNISLSQVVLIPQHPDTCAKDHILVCSVYYEVGIGFDSRPMLRCQALEVRSPISSSKFELLSLQKKISITVATTANPMILTKCVEVLGLRVVL